MNTQQPRAIRLRTSDKKKLKELKDILKCSATQIIQKAYNERDILEPFNVDNDESKYTQTSLSLSDEAVKKISDYAKLRCRSYNEQVRFFILATYERYKR